MRRTCNLCGDNSCSTKLESGRSPSVMGHASTDHLISTLLALFHLDATWYHILSVPRSLSHLEIKTDMPCSNKLWESVTADVWAHQRLVSPSPSPSLQYTASVRMAVSPVPDVSILNLEPYCALHITLFLLSSIRELSGWATMTGTLSTDRFEVGRNRARLALH